jgi:hypothetical protein
VFEQIRDLIVGHGLPQEVRGDAVADDDPPETLGLP